MFLKGNLIAAPRLGVLDCLPGGCLRLAEDGTVLEILPHLPEDVGGEPVLDFGDCLVLQSFCDMHLHGPQYPMVGMGMDLPLLDWLQTYAFPVEARFADPTYARTVYRRLAGELVAGGTTRVVMFSSLHTDGTLVLMEELERAGVTGYVGKVSMDRNGAPELQETTEEACRELLRWLEACGEFRRIRPIVTPRFTPSCTDALMAFLGKLAAERGLPVQSHLSENVAEMEWVRSLHPDCRQYWETYAKYGLWKPGTVMAHCVHSDGRERAAMAEHGVLAVHCADSNGNLCSGTAPVRAMLREGVSVALGSDIVGGALLYMPQVAAASIRASKVRAMADGSAFLTAAEAYYLATTAGQRYFGAGDGFAVGQKLHAVVLDDSRFSGDAGRSLPERLERALYRSAPADLRAVFSEGRRIR